jgi:hypothetical protein
MASNHVLWHLEGLCNLSVQLLAIGSKVLSNSLFHPEWACAVDGNWTRECALNGQFEQVQYSRAWYDDARKP